MLLACRVAIASWCCWRKVSVVGFLFRPSRRDKPHPQPRTATAAVPSVPPSGGSGGEAWREGVAAGQFSVRERDLPPPRDTELLSQDIAMRLRCPWRDAKPLSNFLIGAACRDQLDDLFLSFSQN